MKCAKNGIESSEKTQKIIHNLGLHTNWRLPWASCLAQLLSLCSPLPMPLPLLALHSTTRYRGNGQMPMPVRHLHYNHPPRESRLFTSHHIRIFEIQEHVTLFKQTKV